MRIGGGAVAGALPWIALLALTVQARWPGPWPLAAAAVVVGAALLVHRRGPIGRRAGLLVLLAGVVWGFVGQQRDLVNGFEWLR